ncbi:hypothetical protein [Roseinatronobacter alkalisoli]|uniref:Uncharacterized protein n=1 Tax=Roseinatronobacter alkalisoli TaxID=3028235 RepID=A0ABT5T4F6_9RHOB|nr:hypothetical protein [Roseinatronobacter sp. HJB301]MDD7969590.1 hypothetical protein [Roseinatronobacter sp. HJB301]
MQKGLFGLLAFCLACVQLPAQADMPLNTRVVMSGHSLTDPIPDMLRPMVQAVAGGRGAVIDRSTIPGSPMDWRWNNAAQAQTVDARADIAGYDLLVLTERVPLLNTMGYHNSADEALRWAHHAWENGADGQGAATVLYASWVTRDTGPGSGDDTSEKHIPFRARLQVEQERWLEIRDHVNQHRPDGMPEMVMIPGPRLMTALYDAIDAGDAPGLNSIDALFSDAIHVNDLGAYVMALAHFAVIYGRSPLDVPTGLGRTPTPEPELARWLQQLVADVVAEAPEAQASGH